MADVFDIDSGGRMDYHSHRNDIDTYNRRAHGGWTPVESGARKDPRLEPRNRRDSRNNSSHERTPVQLYDKLGVPISPVRQRYSRSPSPRRHGHHRRSSERSSGSPARRSAERDREHDGWHSPQRMQQNQQMYSQPPLPPPPQTYQQAPPPPIYQHEQYNASGYQQPPYQQGYNQVSYSQPQQSNFQYSSPVGYPQQTQQGYSGHQQPGPPGEEYSGGWAPAPANYPNMSQPPPPVARPSGAPPPPPQHMVDSKKDNLKKEAAIANEMKQQQATLIKQRDEYLRKTTVLRRELEKLRLQKHELLGDKSPPRDSERILRENAKLQLEIQNKLKSINNVVDMLSGIIGDGLQMKEEENKSGSESPKRHYKQDHLSRQSSVVEDEISGKRPTERTENNLPYYNFVHYDPELHWCRVCDVFPRSAKDYLNHMHSAEHRQVTQEHQLVDTPWHKLPADEELPTFKGAPIKRVPIKGLQFFISATAWYCKLCDTWIGDLHCASLHLKSKNHSHNYSNFVEQNPHWEINWIKDREKAFERCGKLKLHSDEEGVPPAPEPPQIIDKRKSKKRNKHDSFLDSSKEKKRRKKSKKRKKVESSGSSSSSTSSDSSSEDDSDKSKSIRVAMRNKMRMQAQIILKEEMEGKLEALGRLVEEDKKRKKQQELEEKNQKVDEQTKIEDNIINQWMTVSNTSSHDKHILEGLKGRLKQRQEADKEKAEQAAAEQRKREREREERELKEMKEREKRELEERIKQEREKEERDREERERIKDRERNRRKQRSESCSPDRYRGRSRSKSSERKTSRSHGLTVRLLDRQYRRNDKRSERYSPDLDKYRPKRTNSEEERSSYESHFEKQAAESAQKSSKEKKPIQIGPRKLPFIGRMPLFKKKGGDTEEKEIKKEDYDIRRTKFEAVSSARAFIPAPGVVHITKLATPQDPIQMIKINAENPPPPPQIIPEPPQISETEEAPPPPIITPSIDEEMEEERRPPLPPAPEDKPKPGEHLPRDFQEALNIIFPGDQRPELMMAQDPNIMMQYQYGMGYGMMYPGMQMYDYSQDTMVPEMPPPEIRQPECEPPLPGNDDDLAMLGIDAGDMAAQTI